MTDPAVKRHNHWVETRLKKKVKKFQKKKNGQDEIRNELCLNRYGVDSFQDLEEDFEGLDELCDEPLHDLFLESNVGREREGYLEPTRQYFSIATQENEGKGKGSADWTFSQPGVDMNPKWKNIWNKASKSLEFLRPPNVQVKCSLLLYLIKEIHVGKIGSRELRPLALNAPFKSFRKVIIDLLGNETYFGLGKRFVDLILVFDYKIEGGEVDDKATVRTIKELHASLPPFLASEINNLMQRYFQSCREYFEQSVEGPYYDDPKNLSVLHPTPNLNSLWKIWYSLIKYSMKPHKKIQRRYLYILNGLALFALTGRKKTGKRKQLIEEYRRGYRQRLTPGQFMIYWLLTRCHEFEIGPELLKIHFSDFFPHTMNYEGVFKQTLVALIKKRLAEFHIPDKSYAILSTKMTPWIDFCDSDNLRHIVLSILQFECVDASGVDILFVNMPISQVPVELRTVQQEITCKELLKKEKLREKRQDRKYERLQNKMAKLGARRVKRKDGNYLVLRKKLQIPNNRGIWPPQNPNQSRFGGDVSAPFSQSFFGETSPSLSETHDLASSQSKKILFRDALPGQTSIQPTAESSTTYRSFLSAPTDPVQATREPEIRENIPSSNHRSDSESSSDISWKPGCQNETWFESKKDRAPSPAPLPQRKRKRPRQEGEVQLSLNTPSRPKSPVDKNSSSNQSPSRAPSSPTPLPQRKKKSSAHVEKDICSRSIPTTLLKSIPTSSHHISNTPSQLSQKKQTHKAPTISSPGPGFPFANVPFKPLEPEHPTPRRGPAPLVPWPAIGVTMPTPQEPRKNFITSRNSWGERWHSPSTFLSELPRINTPYKLQRVQNQKDFEEAPRQRAHHSKDTESSTANYWKLTRNSGRDQEPSLPPPQPKQQSMWEKLQEKTQRHQQDRRQSDWDDGEDSGWSMNFHDMF